MFDMQSNFSGSFVETCQTNSVTQSLITLVSMILEDLDILAHNSVKKQHALIIVQLFKINSCTSHIDGVTGVYSCSKDSKTTLPRYLDMSAKTHKRNWLICFSTLDSQSLTTGC